MGFYSNRVLPALIDHSMRHARLRPFRERVAGAAEGRVLEIGIGAGANLSHYGPPVRELIGLEPSPQLLARAEARALQVGRSFVPLNSSAEAIPLDDASVDTVVTTWTACSIPDVAAALAEMRRVVRPGGRLLFAEHGRAPDQAVARWQDRLTPLWRRIAGGCHLNRPFDRLFAAAGWRIDRLETGYQPGFRFLGFVYEGSARPH